MTDKVVWTPSDWLRLISVVGAFVLFGLGAYLLHLGIVADGVIDIKSSFVSGTLKTGSAGLFLCFFAFLLIVFVLLSGSKVTPLGGSIEPASSPRHRRLLLVFYASLASALAAGVGAAITQSSIFFFLVGLIGGAILPGVVTALIRE